ncbi:MAG: radical SAM family heme chaperone HemW [Candidatus Omnitrophica bacterium]|nr:radical SAM family heme chaperone HemW [Candidatus Omnitrophota bacterium]
MPSLYVHIPFCRKKCFYCDFYSLSYNPDLASRYIDCLCRQIMSQNRPFSTVYIGGGTPSVLSIGSLKKLIRPISRVIAKDAEFTVEVNPESASVSKLSCLYDQGVSRLSVGLQSVYDVKLKKLGRLNTYLESKTLIKNAGKIGFKHISLDLIYGLWGERLKDWEVELKTAIEIGADHLSLYSLTYEPKTELYQRYKRGEIVPIKESLSAKMYKMGVKILAEHGFKRYEVSNFARFGAECRHNINYWDNNDYLGLGPSAVSYIDGVRFKNVDDLFQYIDRVLSASKTFLTEESLKSLPRAKETAAIKIRTAKGIDFKWFYDKTGYDFLKLKADELINLKKDKLIKYRFKKGDWTGICLTDLGFLFADTVSSALL